METIGRWGIFGGIIENRNRYGDPYGDAMPDVEYTRPDGSTLRFWGFYDGGTTWGFRCMPDQTGTWRYRVAFADGGPSAEGTFECVDQGLPAPLAKDSDNPMWFGRRDGGHVLIRSLHVGDGFFARNMPAARRMAFLDWAPQWDTTCSPWPATT